MDDIPGRCLCGGVRFALRPPTEFCSHCYCESCRLAHGAGVVTWTSVPEERLLVHAGADQIREYHSSPGVSWHFCATCGSSLLYRSTEAPGRVYVAVGSLTGPLDREPDSQVSCEEKPAFMGSLPNLPRYRGKAEPM